MCWGLGAPLKRRQPREAPSASRRRRRRRQAAKDTTSRRGDCELQRRLAGLRQGLQAEAHEADDDPVVLALVPLGHDAVLDPPKAGELAPVRARGRRDQVAGLKMLEEPRMWPPGLAAAEDVHVHDTAHDIAAHAVHPVESGAPRARLEPYTVWSPVDGLQGHLGVQN